jgi:hypothetical protein
VVRRARFCWRCGARQPLRVLRALLASVGASTVVAIFVIAFASLGRSVPEYKPPLPTKGKWASEQEFGPLDMEPGAPSLFAPAAKPSQADPKSTP